MAALNLLVNNCGKGNMHVCMCRLAYLKAQYVNFAARGRLFETKA